MVCCKLPNGIVLEHPKKEAVRVMLYGVNSSKIIGSVYGENPGGRRFLGSMESGQ